MVSWTARALNMREIGRGPAVLVLDNGDTGPRGGWAPHLERLAVDRRVITYDLACAEAADPEFFDMRRHFEIAGHVSDLLAIIEDSGERGCGFIGHGIGGMIGLLAAAERPDLIHKTIMVGSSACYLNRADYRGGLDGRTVDDAFFAVAQDYRCWIRNYAGVAVDAAGDRPASLNFAGRMVSMRPDCALAIAKMILLGDYRARLEDIAVPAVILHLPDDPTVPIEAAHYLHDHLRNSVLEVLNTGAVASPAMTEAVLEAALRRHLGLSALPAMAVSPTASDAGLLH
jgi:sigma-B regulation protein RsbQ